jgi:chromosome segregation ATPase
MSREVRRVEESVEYSRTVQVSEEDPTHLPGAPLVTFDLHFDNLREFLNSVSQAVNQHAKVIRFLSSELRTRVTSSEFVEVMKTVANAVPDSLRDSPLSGGRTLKEVAGDVASGLKGLSGQIVSLNGHAQRTDVTLEELRVKVEDRATHSEVKKTVKKAKAKVETEVKRRCGELEQLLRDIEGKLLERFSGLEKKFAELELNTLWKLKDCEELLKVRVNEKYVWDAIKSLEDKLRRDLAVGQDAKSQLLEKELRELRRDLEINEKEQSHRLNKLKEDLAHCEEDLERRPKKEDLQRLQDLLDDLRRSLGSSDLADKVRELTERLEKLTTRFSSLKERLLNQGNAALEEELSRLSRSVADLTERLSRKVDLETLNELLSKLNSKAPVPLVVAPSNSIGEEEFSRFKEKVMEFIRGLEKRLERCVKDTDLKALAKKLDAKAEDERVNSEFNAQDYRINTSERNIEGINKELEQIQAVLRKLLSLLETSSSSSALASFKSIPSNCLSCGRGDSRFAPMIPHIKGRDGRLYRADDRMSPGNTATNFQAEQLYSTGADVFSMDTHQQAHREGEENLKLRGSMVFRQKEHIQSKTLRIRPQSAKK